MITEKQHVDGLWKTSTQVYRSHTLVVKSREGHGMKVHCFKPDVEKPLFTLRYWFIKPSDLVQKAKNKLDKILVKEPVFYYGDLVAQQRNEIGRSI